MASTRLKVRGQETQIFLTIDGVLQAGSFTDVLDFSHKPLIDHQQLSFLGETEDQFDLQIHGHEFSFSVNEEDSAVLDSLLMPLHAALDAGAPMPRINLTVITAYRDPATPVSTKMLLSCTLKPDSLDAGGRKEFNKHTLSGRCRKVESV